MRNGTTRPLGIVALVGFGQLLFTQFGLGQTTARQPAAIAQAMEGLVRAHRAWGPAASLPPGATLIAKESLHDGKVIKFRLYANGVPTPGVYSLVNWPVTQRDPAVVMTGVTLDKDGLAVCAGTPGTCVGNGPNDPIDVVLNPVPGEPARLGLISPDQSARALVTFVPVPLQGTDTGCKVQIVLLTPASELLLVEGSGFAPGSDINMTSESEGERHGGGKAKADSNGQYSAAISPYVQGKASGTVQVTLKSAECSPSVRAPWGRRN